jgi:hypothetical protein
MTQVDDLSRSLILWHNRQLSTTKLVRWDLESPCAEENSRIDANSRLDCRQALRNILGACVAHL